MIAFLGRVALVLFIALAAAMPGPARAQLQGLADRIPSSANAIVLFNVDKAVNSPAGKAGGYAAKLEAAYQEGLICVPPGAKRFVLGAQLDLEFMSPVWEAAVVELEDAPSLPLVAKAYLGQVDDIDGTQAAVLPNDAYVVKLGPKTLGAMAPANRQAVVRWLRETGKGGGKLSPYLQRAVGDADAGSEIVIALDLDGVRSPQQIQQALAAMTWLDAEKIDRAKLAPALASIEGVRLGVRVGQKHAGTMTVDFRKAPGVSPTVAKRLLLETLGKFGMLVDDLQNWSPAVKDNSVVLSGELSPSGMRMLLSLVEMPALAPAGTTSTSEAVAVTNTAAQAARTKEYFKAVNGMFDDLKDDMKESVNLASTTLWFDKYARRIERLPMLDVDPEMLDYGAFVADHMRQASGAVRTMGIRSNVRQKQTTSSGYDAYGYGGYGYGRYGYGAGAAGQTNQVKAVEQQRGVVRAEEKGVAAFSVQEIKAAVIASTTDMRRKMTEKYKTQF